MAEQLEKRLTPQEKQEILMAAFKADRTAEDPDELYYWMKNEYIDTCSSGDVCINSILDKYHLEKQEKATEYELRFIWSLYDSFINDYKQGENSPHRPW